MFGKQRDRKVRPFSSERPRDRLSDGPNNPRSFFAARSGRILLLAIPGVLIAGLFLSLGIAGANKIEEGDFEIRGDEVFRWRIQHVDATWIRGNASLRVGGRIWRGREFVVLTDGDTGHVRHRIASPAKAGDKQRAWKLFTLDEPILRVRHYRGSPREIPAWSRPLIASAAGPVSDSPAASGAVQTAGFVEPFAIRHGGVAATAFQNDAAQTGDDAGDAAGDLIFIDPPPPSAYSEPPSAYSGSGAAPGTGSFDAFGNPLDAGALLDGAAVPGLSNPPGFSNPPDFSNPPGLSTAAGDPAIMGDEGGFRLLVGGGSKAIQWRGRSLGGEPKLTTINRPETGESLLILRGGLTLSIQDVNLQLPGGTTTGLGTISISADRLVAWTPLFTDLLNDPGKFNTSDGELYLEGDIVFKQGERTIYAQSMYYNVTAERGVILDAEAITPIPDYQGLVRLKADVIQQIAAGNFLAFDAAVTTSRMGLPRYWLQSGRVQLSQRATVKTDPNTNTPVAATEPYLESGNNFVYVAGVPVFAWPTFASPLRIPTFYLSDLDIRNDNILGTQVLLDWNLFQVLGIDDAPPGVEWTLSTDFLSERGPAVGTTLEYDLPGLFGVPGVARGQWDSWIIDDDGLDNLGSGRRDLAPERSLRGRSLLRHRQVLPADYEFIAEVGWLSDRNFLEQYLENEWDRDVDHRTSLRLRRFFGANQFDLFVTPQVNEFFTTTQSLPELRHYLTGGSLLGDRLSYSMHNRAAYQKLEPADAPDDPSQTGSFTIAPGVANVDGAVASTRQEIGLPVSLGPIKVVPNVSGEATYFGEGLDGDDVTRLTGGGGVRASLPMWRADPNVQSALLNVDGLAHKVDWQFEYQYADSTTSVDEIPYYDSLDDNAQEEFRRRFTFDAFGGILPEEFEPRNHFLRQGYQSRIASPSHSTVDDMNLFRLGVHQRFQTRRGLRGSQRMVDLFELDIDTIVFADADRDNFGETIGPTTYDAAYRIGDRVSLLSDGYFDFFSDGLRSVALGVETSRPGLGDVYVGLLSLEGPLSSTVLRTLVNYRLNEKWIFSGSTVYDFGDAGNVGQTLALTRIGESFLIRLGVSVDEGRDNVGFRFAIEPRFWLRPKLGRLGGELIPPPGVTGIE